MVAKFSALVLALISLIFCLRSLSHSKFSLCRFLLSFVFLNDMEIEVICVQRKLVSTDGKSIGRRST